MKKSTIGLGILSLILIVLGIVGISVGFGIYINSFDPVHMTIGDEFSSLEIASHGMDITVKRADTESGKAEVEYVTNQGGAGLSVTIEEGVLKLYKPSQPEEYYNELVDKYLIVALPYNVDELVISSHTQGAQDKITIDGLTLQSMSINNRGEYTTVKNCTIQGNVQIKETDVLLEKVSIGGELDVDAGNLSMKECAEGNNTRIKVAAFIMDGCQFSGSLDIALRYDNVQFLQQKGEYYDIAIIDSTISGDMTYTLLDINRHLVNIDNLSVNGSMTFSLSESAQEKENVAGDLTARRLTVGGRLDITLPDSKVIMSESDMTGVANINVYSCSLVGVNVETDVNVNVTDSDIREANKYISSVATGSAIVLDDVAIYGMLRANGQTVTFDRLSVTGDMYISAESVSGESLSIGDGVYELVGVNVEIDDIATAKGVANVLLGGEMAEKVSVTVDEQSLGDWTVMANGIEVQQGGGDMVLTMLGVDVSFNGKRYS